jgi:hypothetical protein
MASAPSAAAATAPAQAEGQTLKSKMNGCTADLIQLINVRLADKLSRPEQEAVVDYAKKHMSGQLQIDSTRDFDKMLLSEEPRFKRWQSESGLSWGMYHSNLEELIKETVERLPVLDLNIGPRKLHLKMKEEQPLCAAGSTIFGTTTGVEVGCDVEVAGVAVAGFGIMYEGTDIESLGDEPWLNPNVAVLNALTGQMFCKGSWVQTCTNLRLSGTSGKLHCRFNPTDGRVSFKVDDTSDAGSSFDSAWTPFVGLNKKRRVRIIAWTSLNVRFSGLSCFKVSCFNERPGSVTRLHWDKFKRHRCLVSLKEDFTDLTVEPLRAFTDPASAHLYNELNDRVQTAANTTDGRPPVTIIVTIFADGTILTANMKKSAKGVYLKVQNIREGAKCTGTIRLIGLAPISKAGKMDELQAFLAMYTAQLSSLETEGCTATLADGQRVRLFPHLVWITADIPEMALLMCMYAGDDPTTLRPLTRALDSTVSFRLKLKSDVLKAWDTAGEGSSSLSRCHPPGSSEDDGLDGISEDDELDDFSDEDSLEHVDTCTMVNDKFASLVDVPNPGTRAPAEDTLCFEPVPMEDLASLDDTELLLHCEYYRVVATPKGGAPAKDLQELMVQYGMTRTEIVNFLRTNAVDPLVGRLRRIPEFFKLKCVSHLSAQVDFLHVVILGLWKTIMSLIPGAIKVAVGVHKSAALKKFNANMKRISKEAAFPRQRSFADGIFTEDTHKLIANLGGAEVVQIARVGFAAIQGCLTSVAPVASKQSAARAEANILSCWIALLNWHSLLSLPTQCEDTLEMIECAFVCFLDTLPAAFPQRNHFNLPKMLLARNFARGVLLSGLPIHHCASHFERSHIDLLKKKARLSNQRQIWSFIANATEKMDALCRHGWGTPSCETGSGSISSFETVVKQNTLPACEQLQEALAQCDDMLLNSHFDPDFVDDLAAEADCATDERGGEHFGDAALQSRPSVSVKTGPAKRLKPSLEDLGRQRCLRLSTSGWCKVTPKLCDPVFAGMVTRKEVPWLRYLPRCVETFAAGINDNPDLKMIGDCGRIELYHCLDMGPSGQPFLLRANPGLRYSDSNNPTTRFDCAKLYWPTQYDPDQTRLCRVLTFFRCWSVKGYPHDCAFVMLYDSKGTDERSFCEKYATATENIADDDEQQPIVVPTLRVFDVTTIKRMVQMLPDMSQPAPQNIGSGVDIVDQPAAAVPLQSMGHRGKSATAATSVFSVHRGSVNRWIDF